MEKTRKTLNLIALAVFLSSNFLTPLSYAEADLGVIRDETPIDSHVADVPQNDEGDTEGNNTPIDSLAEPQNDDSTSSRAEGNEGEGSSNNSETPIDSLAEPENDGNTQENNTPMDSHVADAPQNDNEQPDGQEGTTENSAIDELKELIENEENNSEIVETEGIYGTGKYEGVKVEVYAQTGAFPLGTILNIIPITGDDEMSDIQDVLEQQKNVEKSQKVIAFDITFLDPETEEELQPLMTGAVQVTFNYEENDEFVAAEENEEQEVKVYHLNDKDDEGEKIESITGTIVEDAVVNEEASDEVDNAVVIDAESFSYYTIVVQIREEAPESDPTQTWQYGEDYFTINIARPSGFSSTDYPIEGFTIMDRNLGASISGTTCNTTNAKGACGYLYQWGNNYGFPISANASSILTGVGLTWDNSYNNNGYVSKKFVNGNSLNYDVWSDSSHHDGVWGGANDVNFSSSKNSTTKLYWDDGGDRTLRQGPCPEGWHVPSAGEWSMLLDYWYYTNYKAHPSISQNLYYFSDSTTDSTKRQAFMDYFYIPLAGNRNYSNASLDSQGSYGSYWSSSPFSASSRSARDLYLVSISVNVSYNDYRAYGFSVRCFKDSYVASPESSNLVDTQAWVEGEDFETITISNPDNINEGFTIMDRNLGATATGYGASASADSYGFKYQWGNNYGFRDSDRVTAVTAGLTYNSIYDNHGYYSTNFINGSSHDYDVWDGTNPTANGKEHHDGLWGGANDSSSNNRGANQTNPTDRQGPCPVGYHVPSAGEWGLLIKYWAETKDNGTSNNANWGGSNGLFYLNSNYGAFQQKFNLPFAGCRDCSDASLWSSLWYQGSYGYYWSSSPYSASSNSARFLYLNSTYVGANSNHRHAYGFSVRCFKDSYVAPKVITYNPNGGAFSGMSVNEATVVTYTKNASGTYVPDINIQFPNREGYMFDGWYTTATNQTTERRLVMEESTAITDVYAKWLEFEPYDVKDDNGNTLFTIMDRNLGATTTGTTCSSSNLPACGKLFQWGNNYGFDNSTSPWPYRTGSASVPYTDLVDASEYGPGNYYSSSTFILRPDGSDYYRWDKTDNANLWGGAGDTDTSRGPGTDADRQGPCPVNYHVPSTLEWKSAYNLLGLTSSAEGVTKLQTKLWLPFAGYRYRGNSNVYYQGSYGYYWSSTRYNENNAYYLYFNSSNIYPQRYTNRSYAFSVRCFKDSPTQTLTFVREGAGTVDSKQVYWYEPIQSSYKPSAPSGTTETWYTDAELTSPFTFGDTTYVTEPKTLYSEITCSNPSQIFDGTSCVTANTVTFEPENGDEATIVQVASLSTATALDPEPTKEGYTFAGWYLSGAESAFDFSTPITGDITLYAKRTKDCGVGKVGVEDICVNPKDIIIQATATEANQTLKINKYFANDYTVDWGDGTAVATLSSSTSHPYSETGVYNVVLSLTGGADRWGFRNDYSNPLVPKNGTTVSNIGIIYMPSLADGFGNGDTNPGNNFFYSFNYNGKLESLPDNSFNTSQITTAGNHFFDSFNYWGSLTSLPDNSFNISQITTVGDYFFSQFDGYGKLERLPDNSFNTSQIITAGDRFFSYFNYWGKLESLPDNSFNTSQITTAGNHFFESFNYNGKLESLPDNSFNISQITTVGDFFFSYFNYYGNLTSLPEGSFDTSKITTAGDSFFVQFNYNGKLERLPDSFKLTSVAYDKTSGYISAFNSPEYTLNRKVSDLVDGITPPSSDRNTFSDNQPGRCGVDANWLVSAVSCEDDGYRTVKFNSNGGSGLYYAQTVTSGSKITEPTPEPTKDGAVFDGWYKDNGTFKNKWNFATDTLTEDITLYVKWIECGAGENYYPEIGACATRDADDIVYYWTDENGKDVISIKDPNGNTILTMLDKNEGASVAGLGEDSYGELYQRGNNAPIKTASTSTDRAEYKNYWPGHSFYDATFRYGSSMYDYWQNASTYNDTHYDNLWGGSGDSSSNSRGGINNGDTRQGPCSSGYHVPSIQEWETVLQYFAGKVDQSLTEDGDFHYFSNSTNNQKFQNVFLIPFAGNRNSSSSFLESQGTVGLYWSSSPYGYGRPHSARYFRLNSSSVGAPDFNNRASGLSIRCFKDSPDAPETLTLTFDANGGTLLGADSEGKLIQKVEAGKKAQQPVGISKVGATFQGWVYADDEAIAFDFSTQTVNSNIQLKAKWPTQYTITFDATTNGASSTTQTSITDTEGKVVTLPTCNETKSGYTCIGWNTTSGAHEGKSSVTLDDNITVYAIFSKTLTANFVLVDSNAATLSSSTSTCTYYNNDSACTLSAPTLTAKAGYTVDGWSTANGSTTADAIVFVDGGTYYSVTHNNTPVTVTFNANGNGGPYSPESCYKYNGNSTCSITSPAITPANGFTTIGWSTANDRYENDWTAGGDKEIGSSATYFAQAQKAGYTVTLNYSNGVGVSSISPTSKTCNVATVYNGDSQIGCYESAPTVNCSAGYSNPQWNTSLSAAVLSDTTYTATCSDSEKPVCSITTQPTRTSMSLVEGYTQGTVTFTCTDNVGVSTTNLSESNINYDSNVVTLSNFTAGGTSTSKTFTFTYTANAAGSTTFTLNAGAVSDAAGNSNVVTDASNTVTVDTTAPTITITQPNAGTWTQSKSVTASASDGTLTMKESTSSTCNSGVQGFVAYTSKTYSLESDNGTYICYKAVDSAGNEAYLSSAKVEKIDTTAPTLASKTSFGDTWYTQNPTSTFTYTDTGSGISGTNTRTCQITQEGSASTCKIENVSVCDIAGNCNTDDQTSNPAKLDRTQPVCGTWTYQPISQTNTDVTATLAGSTDATSGIKKAGGTCTLTSNEDTCDVTIEDNAGLTRVCTSQSVNNIDKVKPEGTIQVVTSTPKSTTQEVKLICSDNVGVSSYYWGQNSNPAITDYTSITNVQTNYEVTETVDAAGTYYLLCKDEAGNVSDSKSQVYNSYEVHNMLNAVDKEESTYDSTNYPQDGSTATYIAPAGTILALVDVYTVPAYSAANMYKGYTTAANEAPDTSASVTLNSNSTYYFWFDRTKYDLNLIKNTGIETIYYKVDGVTSYSNTGDTTSVSMKAGSNVYAYAVASSGYTLTGDFVNYDENTPWEKDDVLANQEFAPNTTMNEYIVTWKDYDGRELSGAVYHYNDDLIVPSNPSRAEDDSYTYTFKGWNPEPVEKVTEDAVYTAEYEATPRGSRSSGAGGRSKETQSPIDVINETVNENVHHAADEKEDIESKTETRNETKSEDSTQSSDTSDTKTAESKYTQEFVEAYEFAKNNGVTTMQTIDKAKMNTEMTRIEMAKMLSNYAINVLGKKPDTTKKVLFDDVSSKLDKQYDDAVTKAYQLGIMGQNMSKNRFRPQDKVSRAEFATALSRMIYNTSDGEYAGTRKYYTSHMAKLYNEGIINKTDPSIKEKRGYVMIMLMRTVK